MEYHTEGFYTSDLLDREGIYHGFGTRFFVLPDYLERIGIAGAIVPHTKQVHGADVHFFGDIDPSHTYSGDAWITNRPGVVCCVRTADCLPLLIYDPVKRLVGAVHAGWRGLASHIVKKTLSGMSELGSRVEDIIVTLGPHINRECYEVGTDLKERFVNKGWDVEKLITKKGGSLFFGLSDAILLELKDYGIRRANIDSIQLCTHCNPHSFYSHRGDPDSRSRQVNFIGVIRK